MIYDMLAPTAQSMQPNSLQSSMVSRYFDPQMLQASLNNYPSPYQQQQAPQQLQQQMQNPSSLTPQTSQYQATFEPAMPMRNLLYLNNLKKAQNYYQSLPPLPQTPAPQPKPTPTKTNLGSDKDKYLKFLESNPMLIQNILPVTQKYHMPLPISREMNKKRMVDDYLSGKADENSILRTMFGAFTPPEA